MQYFILSISSLINSFSIFESGDKIKFKYHYIFKDIGDLDNVYVGDFILGYKKGVNLVKYVFKVDEVNSNDNELILEKVLEFSSGVNIEDEGIIDKLEVHEIIKISTSQYNDIYNKILTNLYFVYEEDKNDNLKPNLYDLKSNGDDLESRRICCGINVLFYGVPGVGKSWTVKNEICNDVNEHFIERVVFHPDYTYSDFIGQILPIVSENEVIYKFVEGPFTRILKKAYENPSERVILIIEEINRGNAPSIFGDIFQLLDRMKENADGFKKGTSEFGITNAEIADKVYHDKKHKVRIPSNLSIIATMNTSDQNVFTLDTAFKRRWHMEMIENDFTKPEFKDMKIPNSEISWEIFGIAINEIILDYVNSSLSSEDKRLGAYFVDEEDLKYSKLFAEKVLMYLWDDVFKFSREDYFNKNNVEQFTLDCFIKEFVNTKEKDNFKIFTNIVNNKIKEVKERLSNGLKHDSE